MAGRGAPGACQAAATAPHPARLTHPAWLPHRPQVDVPQRRPCGAVQQAGFHPLCRIPVPPRSSGNTGQWRGRGRQRKGAARLRPRPVLQLYRAGDSGSGIGRRRHSDDTGHEQHQRCASRAKSGSANHPLCSFQGCKPAAPSPASNLAGVAQETQQAQQAGQALTTSKSGSLSSPARRRWCTRWCASAASSFSRSTDGAEGRGKSARFGMLCWVGGCTAAGKLI